MKKIYLLIVMAALVTGLSAQDSAALRKHYLKVYGQALAFNDVNAAINSLHGFLAVDNNILYKDTLSMLYFSTKNYYSSLLLAEEVYKAESGNIEAMARAAECYDELGDPKTATGLFEQIVPKTKSPYHAYKMAVCQYQLKRNGESEASAKYVLADTNSKKIGVPFTAMNGSQQAISVAAAAANLIGVLRMDAKNYPEAKKYFEEALKLFPEFVGAKENLAAVDKVMKTPKTPAKSPVKKG
jgi:tetratricopeptide (TPR) repeat protein